MEETSSATNQPVEETSSATNEPLEETSSANQELNKSVGIVLDYISDKISQNLSQNTDGVQNGFRSVNKAAETMALSGGKRKTRKFKITKKNKTRYSK